jgi:hypothetical protein
LVQLAGVLGDDSPPVVNDHREKLKHHFIRSAFQAEPEFIERPVRLELFLKPQRNPARTLKFWSCEISMAFDIFHDNRTVFDDQLGQYMNQVAPLGYILHIIVVIGHFPLKGKFYLAPMAEMAFVTRRYGQGVNIVFTQETRKFKPG